VLNAKNHSIHSQQRLASFRTGNNAKSTREAWVCRSLSYYVEVCLYKAFRLLSTDFHNKHTNKHRQTLYWATHYCYCTANCMNINTKQNSTGVILSSANISNARSPHISNIGSYYANVFDQTRLLSGDVLSGRVTPCKLRLMQRYNKWPQDPQVLSSFMTWKTQPDIALGIICIFNISQHSIT